MLHDAIEIRKLEDRDKVRYEVYDADTGTSLGLYDHREEAEEMRRSMQDSDEAADKGGHEADPGAG